MRGTDHSKSSYIILLYYEYPVLLIVRLNKCGKTFFEHHLPSRTWYFSYPESLV